MISWARAISLSMSCCISSDRDIPGRAHCTSASSSSRPVVMLLTPPAAYSDAITINAGHVANGVIPALRSVAATLSVPVIEIHAATSGHPEWFPDGVHPNADGMAAIAATVAAALPPAGGEPGTPQEPGTPAGASDASGDSSSRGGNRDCGLGEGFALALGLCAHAFFRPKRTH